MNIQVNYERGIANPGNLYRIKSVMNRALAGEEITIGFLGGSITQGCLASEPELCYAYQIYKWWMKRFPKAKINYINAGIGATDSQFGCARVYQDLLRYRPDFVIIEYSVNDCNNEHYMETYEGVVRKVYASATAPAVMLVHNVFYQNGENAQEVHGKIAGHYHLPSVSMQSSIYPLVESGELSNREITPDDLHPNDLGHELVANVIAYRLDQILFRVSEKEEPAFSQLPKPLTANAYEDSVRLQNQDSEPVLSGFTKDESVQEHITDVFKNGWTAKNPGDRIEFDIEGSCIGVQYRKTMQLPAPVAKLTVDGREEDSVLLDANFEETWGDKPVLDTVLEHGEKGMHHVCIELVETHADDKLPFYLVSLIGSGK